MTDQRDINFALYRASWGWVGQEPERSTYRGTTVLRGRPKRPFGTATHGKAELDHLPVAVLTAWRGGKFVGQMVRWQCGASTQGFALKTSQTQRLCDYCALRAGGIVMPLLAVAA